jgi:tRNA(Met) cytidine acetyltransferase
LLAQSLAAHVGLEAAPCLQGARVIRIAVHPALQGQGLGSRLLEEIRRHYRNAELDYLGASFGATTSLLHFWRKQDFLPVRIGIRRGASSGYRSIIMLSALSPAGEDLLRLARERFRRQLPHLLAEPLRHLQAELACALLKAPGSAGPLALDEFDWLDLIGFAFARRGYETSLTALQILSLRALADAILEPAPAQLLVCKVIQHRDWSECAQAFALTGRAAVETKLRLVMAQLILHYADEPISELALKVQTEAKE